jgi:hypothetical protein
MTIDGGRRGGSAAHLELAGSSEDERAALVRQVLASRTFAKSVRLSHFLEFVCRKTIEGRVDEVNEQQIGVHVFGRSTAYNATDDSIVRTQARLLRQRLEEYFEHECPACPMVVLIPKGGYVPVFERRAATPAAGPGAPPPATPARSPDAPDSAAATAAPTKSDAVSLPAAAPSLGARLLPTGRWWPALAAAVAAIALLLVWLLPRQVGKPAPTLWSSVFASGRPVVIVPSDDGLVLFEELQHAAVDLDEYLSGSYLARAPGQSAGQKAARSAAQAPGSATTAGWLSSHQYTSTADLGLALRLDRLPEARAANVTTRYARVLHLDDLKANNIILIGGVGANPWVELFSHELNFDVNYDWKNAQGYVVNRKPLAGEQPAYRESPGENSPISYGVLAYLPGITGEGTTLLFDGSGMAGTEAAADFPFSGERFASFLDQVGRGPGASIPFFEVLLETRSLGGNAPEARIIGWRRIGR